VYHGDVRDDFGSCLTEKMEPASGCNNIEPSAVRPDTKMNRCLYLSELYMIHSRLETRVYEFGFRVV